jgi:hypothetical protein
MRVDLCGCAPVDITKAYRQGKKDGLLHHLVHYDPDDASRMYQITLRTLFYWSTYAGAKPVYYND